MRHYWSGSLTGRDAGCLRTYGWAEPTLTLGYFQSLSQALAEPRWRGVPVVRRATGGGAIWHDHELTYAIVLPSHHARARPSTALYQTVHAAITATLRARAKRLPTSRHRASGPVAGRTTAVSSLFVLYRP